VWLAEVGVRGLINTTDDVLHTLFSPTLCLELGAYDDLQLGESFLEES
jgi:hypothetical protein